MKPVLSSALLKLGSIKHGFFTREGGNSSGIYASLNCGRGSNDDPKAVEKNRQDISGYFGIASHQLISPHQVHSANVIGVTEAFPSANIPRVDGLVTATPRLALGILTADCGPILFADEKSRVIGACHSGWKGAIGGVIQNTIGKMEDLGARRTSITAVLGPVISQEAYEVGPEFKENFITEATENKIYFRSSSRAEHFMFDLETFIIDILVQQELHHIESMNICTYGDEDRFFSYRRSTHRSEPDYGRQLSAICLEP